MKVFSEIVIKISLVLKNFSYVSHDVATQKYNEIHVFFFYMHYLLFLLLVHELFQQPVLVIYL